MKVWKHFEGPSYLFFCLRLFIMWAQKDSCPRPGPCYGSVVLPERLV